MSRERILIYRQGAIGDVIHTLPLVRLLKEKKPSASIEYAVAPVLTELLESSTDFIDKVWPVRRDSFEEDIAKAAHAETIDEFIFLHSAWWKAWWINLQHVHAREVFCYKRDEDLTAVSNYVCSRYPELKQDLIADAFEILQWQNLKNSSSNPSHSQQQANYICIVAGVGKLRPHRAYPLENWIEFIKQKLASTDLDIKILGGPDEMELSEQLTEILPDDKRLKNLIGKTSLSDLVDILSKAKHLYSADTGILHIGAAVGLPITAIFSITSEKRFGPFTPNAKIIRPKNCKCQPSLTNQFKHCKHLAGNYPQCVTELQLQNDF